ncbi:hypothetical protein [Vibrio amylolyticus]|uniref:hypothetical protein n=1 Tax=Vibrio amylolyticus TaxID=2847292 RepID=UPI0035501549
MGIGNRRNDAFWLTFVAKKDHACELSGRFISVFSSELFALNRANAPKIKELSITVSVLTLFLNLAQGE